MFSYFVKCPFVFFVFVCLTCQWLLWIVCGCVGTDRVLGGTAFCWVIIANCVFLLVAMLGSSVRFPKYMYVVHCYVFRARPNGGCRI